ncbi:tenecin-1-like [Phlebotomus papatasi]|uniref:tenecin-1-like n=1 Tax=Phlebotomus papatasi TaxID=29031 RepID=UPI002483A5EE|nr:tenecin-1-like [Phlebotomus papatasi]
MYPKSEHLQSAVGNRTIPPAKGLAWSERREGNPICRALFRYQIVAVFLVPKEDAIELTVEENPELVFQPRVTCDILGPTGWGDAFCAGHCIYLGYAGGWCDDRKVCNCRN